MSAFKYSLFGNIIDIWKIARVTKSFVNIDIWIDAFVSTFVCLFKKELSILVKSSIHRLYIFRYRVTFTLEHSNT